jgi:hypothetical protein
MPTLLNLAPIDWTDEQLLNWAQGELTPGVEATERTLADETFKRFGEPFGTINEAKELLKSDSMPSTTPTEPEPVVEAQPVPVVVEPVKPEPPPATPALPVTPTTPAPATPGKATEKLSATQILIEENLLEYLEKMAPGRSHNGNAGELLQLKFYRTIQTILRLEGSEFTKTFSKLLLLINEHRQGVFHERYVFRYFDGINLTNPERRNFERIVNLIITTCNPKTRKQTMRQVDIDATMQGFKNGAMHQRVMEFYTGL